MISETLLKLKTKQIMGLDKEQVLKIDLEQLLRKAFTDGYELCRQQQTNGLDMYGDPFESPAIGINEWIEKHLHEINKKTA